MYYVQTLCKLERCWFFRCLVHYYWILLEPQIFAVYEVQRPNSSDDMSFPTFVCGPHIAWLIMSITFGELRYIVANVSFIFAIMTNVRCSCFSSKVLQKVWAVNDKNMDGPRLMNHSILCATEKRGGGKIMHRAGKMGRKIGAGWKLCIGKRCLQGSLTHLMPRWLTQFQIACV